MDEKPTADPAELPLEGGHLAPRNVVRFDLAGFPDIENRPVRSGDCRHRRPQLDRRLRRVICGQCGETLDAFQTLCDFFDHYAHVEQRIAHAEAVERRLNQRSAAGRAQQTQQRRQQQSSADKTRLARAFNPPVPTAQAADFFGTLKQRVAGIGAEGNQPPSEQDGDEPGPLALET